jgi:tetratricopeptide (TPR) repeat protein
MSKTISVFKELARAYEDKNFAAEAEQVWQQVAQLDPADPDVQARNGAAAPAAPVYEAPPPAPSRAPQNYGATAAMPAYPPASSGSGVQATAVQQSYQPAQTTVASAVQKPANKAPGADNLGKLLTETDVYVKYGLHDKALEHLRKVFAIDPENIDAHEKAYAIYVASNNQAQSFEQLLNVLRLHTRSGDAARAQPYLATILQTQPGHPEVPVFLSALRMAHGGATGANQQQVEENEAEDAILVDSSDDEVIVAEEPEDVISGEVSADVADEVMDAAEVMSDEVMSDEVMLSASDADAAGQVEVDPPPVPDSYEPSEQQVISDFEAEAPISYDAAQYDTPDGEPTTGEFMAEAPEDEDAATGNIGLPVATEPSRPGIAKHPLGGIPLTTQPMGNAPVGLGDDDEHEAPTRVSPRIDPSMLRAARPPIEELRVQEDDEPPTATTPVPEEAPAEVPFETADSVEEAVSAPPEDEPASEECDEATFFVEQQLYDEAREILETVLIAYPDHKRAAELMARVEAEQNGGAAPAAAEASEANGVEHSDGNGEEGRDAFDLAAELANELGDFGDEQSDTGEAPTGGGSDEYQVSVEEVFAEFKKGLEKVVKPEDVDTHYDLGVAYKEMGLVDDAIGEFTIARKGCLGKRKEIDCLSMIGMLQVSRGEMNAAIDAYQQGLASDHAKGDVEKSLRYELAVAYEAANQPGRALNQYLKVQALDGKYRETASAVARLSATTVPEEDPPPPPPKGGAAPRAGARKVGYV